jgi:hypothetical protein
MVAGAHLALLMPGKAAPHRHHQDRHEAYKKLRLAVLVQPGGDLAISGILKQAENLGKNEGTSRSTARRRLLRPAAFNYWL